jgi:hypothetical protein
MKAYLLIVPLLTLYVYAQAPTPPVTISQTPASKLESLANLPPETLIATVDGEEVTAGMIQAILRVLPQPTRQQVITNSGQFLRQYGLFTRLAAMAEKAGLDQKSPLKEQLEYNRMVGLAQAQLMETRNQMEVPPEDAQKYYEANQDKYTQAKVKVIYVPFSPNPPAQQDDPKEKKVLNEAEAKAKAEKLYAEIQEGADFVKLVKEHSGDPTSAAKDGDFGTIRRSDKIPDAIKNVIFSLEPGKVSQPVRQPNGFYLFRLEDTGLPPFDEVKAQVLNELKQTRFNEWVQATQKSVEIKIENESLFAPSTTPAPPQQQ